MSMNRFNSTMKSPWSQWLAISLVEVVRTVEEEEKNRIWKMVNRRFSVVFVVVIALATQIHSKCIPDDDDLVDAAVRMRSMPLERENPWDVVLPVEVEDMPPKPALIPMDVMRMALAMRMQSLPIDENMDILDRVMELVRKRMLTPLPNMRSPSPMNSDARMRPILLKAGLFNEDHLMRRKTIPMRIWITLAKN